MLFSVFLLLAGLALLVIAGDYFVKGSVGLAERIGVPALIIGLTVVAFGTSAPELFTSVQASLWGSPGIAVGNVVGSNIANVLLVLGLPALIAPIVAHGAGVRRNLAVMLVVTVVFMWLLGNGHIGRLEGLALFLGLCAFIGWQILEGMNGRAMPEHDFHDEVGDAPGRPGRITAYLLAGAIGLPVAAQLTVKGATGIASTFGISDAAIGLTIVAIGTSLPELATTFMAALRRSAAVAIGNVVGSNIFNAAGIMGLTALIAPVDVDQHIIDFDMWVMLGAALLLAVIGFARISLGKIAGAAMFAGFVVYIISVF
ncbi:calcium/sodium antiporter [Aquibium sp. A9E412]|uniref:calcium/sodium antiporter n=1 Tax=Aquibium sp. A9E412 TaxID=2976767 RepID=UPI0025B27C99|nr:calcium/sodium antiporter [Aquibium sp. A9E412]MDN2565003.1 calcium/sodium antiporter [Aquibium sp. A9E412]